MSTFTNAIVFPTLRHSAAMDIVSPFLAGLMYLVKQTNTCTTDEIDAMKIAVEL